MACINGLRQYKYCKFQYHLICFFNILTAKFANKVKSFDSKGRCHVPGFPQLHLVPPSRLLSWLRLADAKRYTRPPL